MKILPILLWLSLPNPSRAEVGVSEHEIVIGSCSDRSGPSKERATAQLEGAQAYFSYINGKGGINGRKLTVKTYDDMFDPDRAPYCFRELVDKGSFMGAFFLGSPQAAKYVSMSQENKIPVLGFISGAEFLYEPVKHYVFAVRASSVDALKEQVGHLSQLGIRTYAVIYQHDAFGAHVLESAIRALKDKGLEPVKIASYERGSLEVGDAVNQIRSASPQAVFLGAVGAPMAEIVKRSKAAGFHPIFATISDDPAFYKAGGAAVDGTIITQVVPSPDDDLPSAKSFKSLLAHEYATAKPTYVAFEGFLDAMVIVEALKRAGSGLTRESFIQALESMRDFDLGLGKGRSLSYGPNDHKGFDFVYHTIVKGGKPVPLRDWSTIKR